VPQPLIRRAVPGPVIRRAVALLVAGTALLAAAALLAPAAHAATGGLTLVSTEQLDPRLSELTFSTPALSSDTGVRVLLPSGYSTDTTRRYPVLYLLNGSLGSETDWTEQGDAEALTAGLGVIVVMPNGGEGGYYTNWWNFGKGGPPEWETYHIDELVPWIDAHYRTIPRRGARAIAGLSMGGFGAFSYAARHPDLFGIAASYSGALDTNDPQPVGQPDESILDGGIPGSTWGPYQLEQINWRAHDPWDLAVNLRGLELMMLTGNGLPGGPYPWEPATGAIEYDIHEQNVDMNARLDALKIPHFYDDYGAGDHSWPYWQRDLEQTLPMIMAGFAHPPASPSRVTFTAAEPSYSVYGWSVSLTRPAMEFSTLSGADAHGFSLSGSGTARVVTPRDFVAGRAYQVTVAQPGRRGIRSTLRANAGGRLRIEVPLGPGNPEAEDLPGASTKLYTSSVAVAPARSATRRPR
jgi:S-formylglutathione hydrolase FrmB